MRDKHGNKLMPMWRVNVGGNTVILAAWTRNEVSCFLKYATNYLSIYEITRIKDCFAKSGPVRVVA